MTFKKNIRAIPWPSKNVNISATLTTLLETFHIKSWIEHRFLFLNTTSFLSSHLRDTQDTHTHRTHSSYHHSPGAPNVLSSAQDLWHGEAARSQWDHVTVMCSESDTDWRQQTGLLLPVCLSAFYSGLCLTAVCVYLHCVISSIVGDVCIA